MTDTISSLTIDVDAIDSRLRTATAQHERNLAALYDAHRRPLHGDEIHQEKVTAAHQAYFSTLDELTRRATETAAAVQRLANGADPLLALKGEALQRAAALHVLLRDETQTVDATKLAARVRGALDAKDAAALEVYRRALTARRAAALDAGSQGDGMVRIDDRVWNGDLETLLAELDADTVTGEAHRLQQRLIDTRIAITKSRQAVDGTADRARADFTAAIRSF